MNFKKLLLCAKSDDMSAIMQFTDMYKPLLIKESIINGSLDDDLYQELWLTLLLCIKKIEI